MNYEKLIEYKNYTLSKVRAHEDEFNPFILAQVDIFEQRCDILIELQKLKTTIKANKEIVDDEENKIVEEVYKFLNFGYKKLDSLTPDVLKIYFPDLPSTTKENLNKILKMYKSVLLIMENDEYNELNGLIDEYKSAIATIETFLPKKNDIIFKKENNSKKHAKALASGISQYAILKLHFKAHFYEKERDYKYFFKDLGNPKPKKK
jgi:hypothetical protein